MKLTGQDIKLALAVELQKTGSSIEEFEVTLKNKDLEKLAAMPDITKILGALKEFANAGGLLAAGTGALAGTGLYAAYKGNQDSSDKVMKHMQERAQYNDATKALQEAMASNNNYI